VNDCNSTVGQARFGSIIALDITDLSSALGNVHAQMTNYTEIALGKSAPSTYAEPFTLANLNWPYVPWVYNQQASCNSGIIDALCPVMISGQYNPMLVVPPQIRSLDPAWSTCDLALQGL